MPNKEEKMSTYELLSAKIEKELKKEKDKRRGYLTLIEDFYSIILLGEFIAM